MFFHIHDIDIKFTLNLTSDILNNDELLKTIWNHKSGKKKKKSGYIRCYISLGFGWWTMRDSTKCTCTCTQVKQAQRTKLAWAIDSCGGWATWLTHTQQELPPPCSFTHLVSYFSSSNNTFVYCPSDPIIFLFVTELRTELLSRRRRTTTTTTEDMQLCAHNKQPSSRRKRLVCQSDCLLSFFLLVVLCTKARIFGKMKVLYIFCMVQYIWVFP